MADAFTWAWNKFSKNAGALVVSSLIYGALIAAIAGVTWALAFAFGTTNAVTTDSYDDYETSFSMSFGALSVTILVVGYAVLFVVGAFAASAFFAGCLDIADGKPVSIGSFFKPRNLGAVILASLLVGIVTEIGGFLCVIPGLIFAFLAYFTILFVIDRSLPVIEALKASIATVRSNIGDTLLSWLVAAAVTLVGALLFGVGLIVALPVAALIQTYAYRRFSGGSTAPLTP